MRSSCLTPFVLLIFNLTCQLWADITFERVTILCWHFLKNLISDIPFIWNSFIKIWDGSCPALVHFTWNDPIEAGNGIISKKSTYVKIKETEGDVEFDEEEEGDFDEDVIDLEFWLYLNSCKSIFRSLSNIQDEAFCFLLWLFANNFFYKKLHHRCLNGLWICLWVDCCL